MTLWLHYELREQSLYNISIDTVPAEMLFPLGLLVASATLFSARAYPNGAPNARLPTLGWSSWIALGPAGSAPVFDYCDEATVKASADAFIALGLDDAGYRHLHLRVGAAALRAVRARGTLRERA